MAFRQHFADHLQAVLPPEHAGPVKVWAMDESRVGLETVRRRLTARGTKPIGYHQHRFENIYRYGAVAPKDGDGYVLGLPKLNANLFQVFLNAFGRARPDTFNVLLVTTVGAIPPRTSCCQRTWSCCFSRRTHRR